MDKPETNGEGLAILFEKAVRLGGVELLDLARNKVANVPNGRSLVDLRPFMEKFRAYPARRAGTQSVVDLPSFVEWVNRHKGDSSALFCNVRPDAPSIDAVIDYHVAGSATTEANADTGEDMLARWQEFRARYPLTLDKRWVDWAEVEKEPLSQVEFAAFLEDHALDLHAPGAGDSLPEDVAEFVRRTGAHVGNPGEIMGLSKDLSIKVEGATAERHVLQSGEAVIKFEERHEATSNSTVVKVPGLIVIAIPVFEFSTDVYRIPVRIRYRIASGKTFWILKRWRAEETFDHAIRDVAGKAAEGTSLPMFFGPVPKRGGE